MFARPTPLVIAALFLVWPSAVLADPSTSGPLTVVVDGNIGASAPYAGTYDFGSIVEGSRQSIRHDFVLRNVTDKPVTIDRLQPTCGCTTALIDSPGSTSTTIAPGAETVVHVTVDAARLSPSEADKAVWVYADGALTPAATLLIRGEVTASIEIEPSTLDFGTVSSGTSRSMTLTVCMDDRVFPQSFRPRIEGAPITVVEKQTPRVKAIAADHLVTRTYTVTLSPRAHLGPLSGWLSFPQPGVTPADWPKAPITGRIDGDIAAYPQALTLESIKVGGAVTDYVDIAGVDASAVSGLKVTTDVLDLRARVVPAPKSAKPNTVRVAVTLQRKKKGPMSTMVHVSTKSGQVLDVPVWAEVE